MYFNTLESLIGSGFLVGDRNHIIAYPKLIHEASLITVKFPSEDGFMEKFYIVTV